MKTVKIILGMSLALMFLSSCDKDVNGCTDSDAVNYNAEANVLDNSCEYQANLMIWWDKAFSDAAYYDFGSRPSFEVSVDGAYAGSLATAVYYTSAPECGSGGGVEANIDLGFVKQNDVTVTYSYQGTAFYTRTLSVTANTCNTWKEIY